MKCPEDFIVKKVWELRGEEEVCIKDYCDCDLLSILKKCMLKRHEVGNELQRIDAAIFIIEHELKLREI